MPPYCRPQRRLTGRYTLRPANILDMIRGGVVAGLALRSRKRLLRGMRRGRPRSCAAQLPGLNLWLEAGPGARRVSAAR